MPGVGRWAELRAIEHGPFGGGNAITIQGGFLTAPQGEFVWHLLQGKDIFLETQVTSVDRLEIGGIEATVAELL